MILLVPGKPLAASMLMLDCTEQKGGRKSLPRRQIHPGCFRIFVPELQAAAAVTAYSLTDGVHSKMEASPL